MKIRIRPCSHCGGKAELYDLGGEYYYRYYVQCPECGITTLKEHISDIAVESWNSKPSCALCKHICTVRCSYCMRSKSDFYEMEDCDPIEMAKVVHSKKDIEEKNGYNRQDNFRHFDYGLFV